MRCMRWGGSIGGVCNLHLRDLTSPPRYGHTFPNSDLCLPQFAHDLLHSESFSGHSVDPLSPAGSTQITICECGSVPGVQVNCSPTTNETVHRRGSLRTDFHAPVMEPATDSRRSKPSRWPPYSEAADHDPTFSVSS